LRHKRTTIYFDRFVLRVRAIDASSLRVGVCRQALVVSAVPEDLRRDVLNPATLKQASARLFVSCLLTTARYDGDRGDDYRRSPAVTGAQMMRKQRRLHTFVQILHAASVPLRQSPGGGGGDTPSIFEQGAGRLDIAAAVARARQWVRVASLRFLSRTAGMYVLVSRM
jgi:hypothetical protein